LRRAAAQGHREAGLLLRSRYGEAGLADAWRESATFAMFQLGNPTAEVLQTVTDRVADLLEKAGMSREQGPIAVMLEEHRVGRRYVQFMSEALEPARAGDEEARARLLNAARGYIDLIRGHIMKEDHVLFDMADHVVRGSSCQSLCVAYGAVCARRFEGHSKEELASLAEHIVRRAGLS